MALPCHFVENKTLHLPAQAHHHLRRQGGVSLNMTTRPQPPGATSTTNHQPKPITTTTTANNNNNNSNNNTNTNKIEKNKRKNDIEVNQHFSLKLTFWFQSKKSKPASATGFTAFAAAKAAAIWGRFSGVRVSSYWAGKSPKHWPIFSWKRWDANFLMNF